MQCVLLDGERIASGEKVAQMAGSAPSFEAGGKTFRASSYKEGHVLHGKEVVCKHWVEASLPCASKDDVRTLLLTAFFLLPVPPARSGGGLTSTDRVKMTREYKIMLAQVLHSSNLSLLHAAEYVRTHVDPSFPLVDERTLGRAASSMGLALRRDRQFDPKQVRNLARKLELESFKEEKGKGDVLRGENLLFIDESNVHLNFDTPVRFRWERCSQITETRS